MEWIAGLILLCVVLGFLLRAAWRAQDRAAAKRLRDEMDAITRRDEKAREIRRDTDEDLVDRLSPPR